jgi:BASS family bile acid:Na+ symporter
MAAIALIIVVITAAGRNELLVVGPLLIVAMLTHNLSGYLLGYWSGRLLRMKEVDCRTIAIEVGLQNAGMASGLALTMGKLATVGLAPAVFAPIMNITGSSLALWWRARTKGIMEPARTKKNDAASMQAE